MLIYLKVIFSTRFNYNAINAYNIGYNSTSRVRNEIRPYCNEQLRRINYYEQRNQTNQTNTSITRGRNRKSGYFYSMKFFFGYFRIFFCLVKSLFKSRKNIAVSMFKLIIFILRSNFRLIYWILKKFFDLVIILIEGPGQRYYIIEY